MDWYKQLTGFTERSPEQVRAQLHVSNGQLCSSVNQQCWAVGQLTLPSLKELRQHQPSKQAKTQVRQLVADVQSLHAQPESAGALLSVMAELTQVFLR